MSQAPFYFSLDPHLSDNNRLSFPSFDFSVEAFPYICTARAWVLMSGFTLSFGSMFSKTWRVHSIFTNVQLNKKVSEAREIEESEGLPTRPIEAILDELVSQKYLVNSRPNLQFRRVFYLFLRLWMLYQYRREDTVE